MKNNIKIAIIGLVVILLIINIKPIPADKNNKEMSYQKTLITTDNILANISVIWDSFLHRFSKEDLEPIVTINQSATKDFYFPEINGTIPQINFSVICKHRLNYTVIIPRFTRVYIAISFNGIYILLNQSINNRCKSKEWEYINYTIESNADFIPLITNGENITLTIEVGAYFFFFKLWGKIISLDPITIQPISTLSQ
ncbi:hypothetical protein AYK25_04625 [Thermoplasmatales archaeon SM1-50]|nr:MAG: hypothetical protein AYK25_04625 [Thermoplasmatales archaeon SM1-50]